MKPLAFKIMKLTKNRERVFQHEADMLAKANEGDPHPSVPYLLGLLTHNDKGYIVLEYLPFPTLSDYISERGALGFDFSVNFLRQIVRISDVNN